MALMHYCTASVNLSGQGFHIVQFYEPDPVSWPEVQVLMALHGEENVMDIKPVRVADVHPVDEKRRLLGKYAAAAKLVEAVFPGRNFRMEMLMPGEETGQPRVDGDGVAIATVPDDEDSNETASEPPSGPPVFKPGRHRPPAEKPAEA